jgi:L-noviosyl transferase
MMRVLITVNPAPGHLFAMVPLAWALHLAGHQVLVAAPQPLAQQIRRAGLSAAAVGDDASFLELWPADRALGGNRELDLEVFVAIAERTASDTVSLTRAWRPALIVSDPVEYSGPLAATVTATPWALHHWGLPVPEHLHEAALAKVRNRISRLYEPFGSQHASSAIATLDTCPPSMREPHAPDAHRLGMRYVPYNGACTVPDWLFAPRTRPRVGVSMGTVPIPEGVDALQAAVDGLSGLDVEVVVSGAGVHGVERLPANARRIGWIPHHHLLPTCDLFVHHGGSGSSMAAITAGRPQLVMPQMCDQFTIAERLTAAGVARCVPFTERGAGAVRAEVERLLGDGSYAERAAGLRDEVAAMPSPTTVAAELTRLAVV